MTPSNDSGPLRPFPMQDGPPIPWCVAEAIYTHLYRHSGQTLERLGERGGFGWAEVKWMWGDRQSHTTPEHRQACIRAVREALASAAALPGNLPSSEES